MSCDPRVAADAARTRNREALNLLLAELTEGRGAAAWLTICAVETMPAGPLNDPAKGLDGSQVAEHHLRVRVPHAAVISLDLLGTPLHLRHTPVTNAEVRPAPREDSGAVPARHVGPDRGGLRALKAAGSGGGRLDA